MSQRKLYIKRYQHIDIIMPEGPEVSLYVKFLNSYMGTTKVTDLKILKGRYVTHGAPTSYTDFRSKLPSKLKKAHSKGKFIYLEFDNGYHIWVTLGLSGKFTTKSKNNNNIEFVMGDKSVYFNDSRNFGTFKFVTSKEDLKQKLKTLGPDILSKFSTLDKLTLLVFKNQFKKYPRKGLALALLDQKIVSGIGNYLSSEMLWEAKISPHRKINSLTDADYNNLYKGMNRVITKMTTLSAGEKRSLKAGDTDFINDYQQHDFSVYRQKKDPQGRVVKQEKLGGRTKWWVDGYQK
jgi:DNA-formamidopyrimidine glycosylase